MIRVKRRVTTTGRPGQAIPSSEMPGVPNTLEALRSDLQYAIELEHATIPPYLTALYSLLEVTNSEIRGLIRSVVIEEMLHMALAANMLSAIGGKPVLTGPRFVPSYPGDLPFHIAGVEVSLAPFSMELVQQVFMRIEEPEHPIWFSTAPPWAETSADETAYQTIGAFYDGIRTKFEIVARDQNPFDPGSYQLLQPPGAFRIDSLLDARRAIDAIVHQGEGIRTFPITGRGAVLAHFYRFSEIVQGFALVANPMAKFGYSYSGYPIPFDPSAVVPILTNAKLSDYPVGSKAARLARQFNELYGMMLQTLENAYGPGEPNDANLVGLMFDMKIAAQKLVSTPVPGSEPVRYAAPTFEVFRAG